ncbi:MAG: hypothetical protein IJB83_05635 [Bacilli bacterium]|nr:hypothetical protein [Bacilli bacterium]
MKEFEKAQKNLKNDMLVLFILELIILVFSLINRSFSFFTLIFAVLLIIGYIYANKGEKVAGTIGIIVGILMMLTILTVDVIDFVLGLFVLLHSLKYNKLIKNK